MNIKSFSLVFAIFVLENFIGLRSETFEVLKPPADVSLLLQYGYPFEEHTVTTSDGYILTMHRIPFSPKNKNKTLEKFPVLIQHGLGFSSTGWILGGPKLSPPIFLADAGYDVWLGNVRGTYFGVNHTTLDYKTSSKFWDFSWHEMGIYDLPVMIDYILENTKKDKLHYIGHSQGASSFVVMASELPIYNRKILSMHALSPAIFHENQEHIYAGILASILGYPSDTVNDLGKRPLSAVISSSMNRIVANACKYISREICSVFMHNFFGYNGNNIDPEITIKILKTTPQGASLKCLLHFFQLRKSGKFRKYDYGEHNINKYGSTQPPDYKLSQITCPVFLYYSKNDIMSSDVDVAKLTTILPSVRLNFSVPHEYHYNHMDFLFAKNVKKIVYKKIIKGMKDVESKL